MPNMKYFSKSLLLTSHVANVLSYYNVLEEKKKKQYKQHPL